MEHNIFHRDIEISQSSWLKELNTIVGIQAVSMRGLLIGGLTKLLKMVVTLEIADS